MQQSPTSHVCVHNCFTNKVSQIKTLSLRNTIRTSSYQQTWVCGCDIHVTQEIITTTVQCWIPTLRINGTLSCTPLLCCGIITYQTAFVVQFIETVVIFAICRLTVMMVRGIACCGSRGFSTRLVAMVTGSTSCRAVVCFADNVSCECVC